MFALDLVKKISFKTIETDLDFDTCVCIVPISETMASLAKLGPQKTQFLVHLFEHLLIRSLLNGFSIVPKLNATYINGFSNELLMQHSIQSSSENSLAVIDFFVKRFFKQRFTQEEFESEKNIIRKEMQQTRLDSWQFNRKLLLHKEFNKSSVLQRKKHIENSQIVFDGLCFEDFKVFYKHFCEHAELNIVFAAQKNNIDMFKNNMSLIQSHQVKSGALNASNDFNEKQNKAVNFSGNILRIQNKYKRNYLGFLLVFPSDLKSKMACEFLSVLLGKSKFSYLQDKRHWNIHASHIVSTHNSHLILEADAQYHEYAYLREDVLLLLNELSSKINDEDFQRAKKFIVTAHTRQDNDCLSKVYRDCFLESFFESKEKYLKELEKLSLKELNVFIEKYIDIESIRILEAIEEKNFVPMLDGPQRLGALIKRSRHVGNVDMQPSVLTVGPNKATALSTKKYDFEKKCNLHMSVDQITQENHTNKLSLLVSNNQYFKKIKQKDINVLNQKISSIELQNSCDILFQQRKGSDLSHVSIRFKGGRSFENEKNNGITFFLLQMILAKKILNETISLQKYLELNSCKVSVDTAADHFGFEISFHDDDFYQVSQCLNELFKIKAFDVDELESYKALYAKKYFSKNADASKDSKHLEKFTIEAFYKNTLGVHPYAFERFGTQNNLNDLSVQRLQDWYFEYCTASNCVLSYIGPKNKDDFLKDSGCLNFVAGEKGDAITSTKANILSFKTHPDYKNKIIVNQNNTLNSQIIGFKTTHSADAKKLLLELAEYVLNYKMHLKISHQDTSEMVLNHSYCIHLKQLGFFLNVFISKNAKDLEYIEDRFIQDIKHLQSHCVDSALLEMLKKKLLNNYEMIVENYTSCSDLLVGEWVACRHLHGLQSLQNRIESIDVKHVRECFDVYFDLKNACTLKVLNS